MKAVALAAGLLWALQAGSVGAQNAAPVVVALDYRAPAGCPEASSFREQVLGRTKRLSFAERNVEPSLFWRVDIAESSGRSHGTLRVTGARPSALQRDVQASSCEQVVDALALVAALSVDPEASLAPREKPQSPTTAPVPAAGASTPTPPAPPRAAGEASATKLSLGLTLTARSGLAPQLAWAPEASVGLSFRSSGGYTWGLVVSATRVRGNAAIDVGQADFTWSLARLDVFPIRARYRNWRFEPAAFVEAGQLRARGVAVVPSAEAHRPVLSVGALARASWLAFDLLWFGVEAGPLVPLIRDRFYLFETSTVFQLPRITGYVGAGVGLEFL